MQHIRKGIFGFAEASHGGLARKHKTAQGGMLQEGKGIVSQ